MFKDLKLSVKQMGGFLLVILILLAVAFSGYRGIDQINGKLRTILETTPLVEAAKEIKLAIAQDIQVVMAITTALDTEELDEIWKVHTEHKKEIALYAEAVLKGAETGSGIIYAARDQELKDVVSGVSKFYAESFEPKVKQLYDISVKKVSAESYDYELADTLPELAGEDGKKFEDMLDLVEKNAKKAINTAEENAAATAGQAQLILIIATAVGIVFAVALAFSITRIITLPVAKAVEFAERMSRGDLSRHLDIDQKDEIGQLAAALNTMVTNLAAMFREVVNGVQTLSEASRDLTEISNEMATGARDTSDRSNTVASAAEEMNVNMNSVSQASSGTLEKINELSEASRHVEEMVVQINVYSSKAREISDKAVNDVQEISEAVNALGKAAEEVDEVTDFIRDISERVNLLALNATIEAARAGEAGKGFAVVAQEIKDLAGQTAEATNKADEKLRWIKTGSADMMERVKGVSLVMEKISGSVESISESVEEQKQSVDKTAADIAQALEGIGVVAENVSQSAEVSDMITKDIADVHHHAEAFSKSSAMVNSKSEALNQLSDKLNALVGKFTL